MKIFLVEVENISKYPPFFSILKCLTDLDIQTVVCSLNIPQNVKQYCDEHNIFMINIGQDYEYKATLVKKVYNLQGIRKRIWTSIDSIYEEVDMLWVFSTITLKHLGKKLMKYKYILHLFELVQTLKYVNKFPIPTINLGQYCRGAYKVVTCEYNRAHITKTWFKLNELPVILPNKPYGIEQLSKDMNKYIDTETQEKLMGLEQKKIVLYQGIVDSERPIENFIKAVDKMGEEYVMIIMTGSDVDYSSLKSRNLVVIPFIPSPYHLFITKMAYIGIVCYVPNYSGYSSPLNSIYCAPNKIYEYSRFFIPMIGNDIPGLSETIGKFDMGVCVKNLDVENICDAIQCIEEKRTEFSYNAKVFYESIDLKKIIKSMVE